MKHFAPPLSTHGDRVEERKRVNGQPNGYRPVSEAEIQYNREASSDGCEGFDVLDQTDNISLDDLYKQERQAKGWHSEESDYWS